MLVVPNSAPHNLLSRLFNKYDEKMVIVLKDLLLSAMSGENQNRSSIGNKVIMGEKKFAG